MAQLLTLDTLMYAVMALAVALIAFVLYVFTNSVLEIRKSEKAALGKWAKLREDWQRDNAPGQWRRVPPTPKPDPPAPRPKPSPQPQPATNHPGYPGALCWERWRNADGTH